MTTPPSINPFDLTEEQRGRLSRRAQEYVAWLERALAERDHRIAQLSAGPEESDIIAYDHVYPVRPLGTGAIIRFLMGADGGYIDVRHAQDGAGYLEVRGNGDTQATSSLEAQPQVSNTLRVRLGRNW